MNHSGPYDFVLDTAAQVTTVDPTLASELHLKVLGVTGVTGAGFSTRASYAQLESVQAGAYALKNQLLFIHNLGQIQVTDPRVRGILGENFLEHFDLFIDYAHGIVCLDEMKQMQEKIKGERIALAAPPHSEQNLPFTQPLIVPVRVSGAGRLLLLQLDSGIDAPLLFDLGKLQPTVFASSPLHSRGTDGVVHAYTVLPPQEIHVGLHSFQQISFVAPVAPGKNVPDAGMDGVLPTALFRSIFISYTDHFAVLDPW
ncbi:MAG TPA: aspartyl protease family protein [Alloacidobacterium sp.]|nr:aspartyl protease family protein [Alloacidobacterium sp.]